MATPNPSPVHGHEPGDFVVMHGRQVRRYEHWVLWKGTPWPVITMERNLNDFTLTCGDPEHGGGTVHGSLDYLLKEDKGDFRLRKLFSQELAPEEVLALLPGAKILDPTKP